MIIRLYYYSRENKELRERGEVMTSADKMKVSFGQQFLLNDMISYHWASRCDSYILDCVGWWKRQINERSKFSIAVIQDFVSLP
jgi:hypothetical protein